MSSSGIGDLHGSAARSPRWDAIIRNYLTFGATEFLSKALSFVLMVYAARVLSVEIFGDFSFALAVMVLVGTLSDFGLSTLLVKKIAQAPREGGDDATVALSVRVGFTVGWTALALWYVHAAGARPTVAFFITAAGAASLVGAYPGVVSCALRALSRFGTDASLRLASTVLYIGAGMAALKLGTGLVGLASVVLGVAIVQATLAFVVNARGRYVRFSRSMLVRWSSYPRLLSEALPFGLLAVLGMIYFRIDMVMLQAMAGSVEVGLYAAAYKILEGVLMIPLALSIVVLPVLSEALAKGDVELARQTVSSVVKYLAYLSVPIATILTLQADRLIALLYPMPAYAGSALGLRILAWTIVAVFASGATSTLIASSRSPSVNTWIACVMAGLNVGLNILLIPRWGLAGAAAATVVTEFSGIFMNTYYINRRLFTLRYESHFVKPCVAALVMGATVYVVNALVLFPVYLLVYGGVLLITEGLSVDELRNATGVMARVFSARGT